MDNIKEKKEIDHLSYSALRAFLKSPAKFFDEYIAKIPMKPSLTMEAGKAWHRGLELYYKKDPNYTIKAVEQLNNKREELYKNFKTDEAKEKFNAKFEKEIKDLARNLESYNGKIDGEIAIEKKATVIDLPLGGLPITGIVDLLDKHGNPVDHKYISAYTKGPLYKHFVQAWFYYYIAKEITGKYPQYFIISEFKKTRNRDKSPQLQESAIIYGDSFDIEKIDQWYLDVCNQIQNQKSFYSNPFQIDEPTDWINYLKS